MPAKSLIKGMQMLRTILLFMILLACCCGNLASDADETSGAQVAGKEAELDMDNQRLPQGTRLAILLVGLFKPNVTDLVALPSLATHATRLADFASSFRQIYLEKNLLLVNGRLKL